MVEKLKTTYVFQWKISGREQEAIILPIKKN